MAARIRALRKAAGMTQEQLSEKADISTQYLSRLENAHQVPSLYVIADLAEALNVPPSVLLGDTVGDEQQARLRRIGKLLSTLTEENAEFLETQFVSWMSHLKKH
ncbi:MAG: helix-turn-helix transcriptional regulator [Armatimonadota bacterium]|nr:helix-turn-helix transcriptional regulator [bacterium]